MPHTRPYTEHISVWMENIMYDVHVFVYMSTYVYARIYQLYIFFCFKICFYFHFICDKRNFVFVFQLIGVCMFGLFFLFFWQVISLLSLLLNAFVYMFWKRSKQFVNRTSMIFMFLTDGHVEERDCERERDRTSGEWRLLCSIMS